jgi:hypothetical protein
MRKLVGLLAGIGLVAGVAAPAQAALLQSASLQVVIGDLPMIPVAWSNTGSADVTGTSISNLTADIFNFSGVIPVTDPMAFPIAGLSIEGATNGVGNFSFDALGNGGGTMAVQGLSNLCLFAPCSASPPANVTVPFTTGGVNGIGLGGSVIVESGLVNLTVEGNSWTTGTASISVPSVGTISQTGTAFDGTSVKLVTPAMISSSIGASAVIPVFATLTLSFIPEPGTALLLAAGAAGLAVVGRKRMSK